MTTRPRVVSVPNPDEPDMIGMPIYEGTLFGAVMRLVPGEYVAWDMDTEEYGTLKITEDSCVTFTPRD